MNGAESLIRSLVNAGVTTCFANPGTSEMHLVQAMDAVPEMRGVLCLFEGVCTGAADGYARIAGKPAVTVLHLGPGLGNGIANLHNARRAATPIINLVGNHATYHVPHDAPLTSDIETLAKNVSTWIKSDSTAGSLAADGMMALAKTQSPSHGSDGATATLIIPAEACWGQALDIATVVQPEPPSVVEAKRIQSVAKALGPASMLLLDKGALTPESRMLAAQVAHKIGCRISMSTFPARVDSGPGHPVVERLPYFPEDVLRAMDGVEHLVLVGAEQPVSFFAYPNQDSVLVPENCTVDRLVSAHENVSQALKDLCDAVDATSTQPMTYIKESLPVLQGKLSVRAVANVVAQHMPENSILCGDSGGGAAVLGPAQVSKAHTWLNLTGGSIGQGGPAAVGAAIAAPDRQVFALLGDGASMYTNQALWTQAREGLNVITVIFNNQIYGILETEYLRLGVNEVGEHAAQLFNLASPAIDFVKLAESMGVPGSRADTVETFEAALLAALERGGPSLIEAMV